jgi:MFS family permease
MTSDQAMPGVTGTPDLLGVDHHGAAAIPKRSLWGLIAISLFWLALNFHWTAMLIVILPSQVEALLAQSYLHAHVFNQNALSDFVNNNKAVTLALVTSPGLLVALVSNPLFGMLSDRTSSRWGRRRPYIIGGTLLNLVGLSLMMIAPNIITLMLALCLTQLGNNAAAAPFHAYLPDLVNEEQRGTAAGIMGLSQIVGIILGALITGLLLSIDPIFKATSASGANAALSTYSGQLIVVYGIVAFVMLLLMVLTSLTVKELPWQPPAPQTTAEKSSPHWFARHRQQVIEGALALALIVVVLAGALLVLQAAGISFDLNGAHLAQSDVQSANNANISINVVLLLVLLIVTLWATRLFDFRPRRDPDFAWVAGTRLLVMLGINTVQAFLQYYFHDVLGSQHQEQEASTFVIILTLTAALTTFFGGWLSNRYGRKRMVYISGGLMSAVAVIFISLNFLTIGVLSQNTGILIARLGGAIFGLGYGAYLSVDWALVADVLPSKERYARDMGIWNIALTVPQVVAFVIGSVLLSIPASAALRYTLLFVVFAIYALAGTITVRYIKAVKR